VPRFAPWHGHRLGARDYDKYKGRGVQRQSKSPPFRGGRLAILPARAIRLTCALAMCIRHKGRYPEVQWDAAPLAACVPTSCLVDHQPLVLRWGSSGRRTNTQISVTWVHSTFSCAGIRQRESAYYQRRRFSTADSSTGSKPVATARCAGTGGRHEHERHP